MRKRVRRTTKKHFWSGKEERLKEWREAWGRKSSFRRREGKGLPILSEVAPPRHPVEEDGALATD